LFTSFRLFTREVYEEAATLAGLALRYLLSSPLRFSLRRHIYAAIAPF
jgi:hypothetical protein